MNGVRAGLWLLVLGGTALAAVACRNGPCVTVLDGCRDDVDAGLSPFVARDAAVFIPDAGVDAGFAGCVRAGCEAACAGLDDPRQVCLFPACLDCQSADAGSGAVFCGRLYTCGRDAGVVDAGRDAGLDAGGGGSSSSSSSMVGSSSGTVSSVMGSSSVGASSSASAGSGSGGSSSLAGTSSSDMGSSSASVGSSSADSSSSASVGSSSSVDSSSAAGSSSSAEMSSSSAAGSSSSDMGSSASM